MIEGFPPIAGPDARVLVLGTCPSVASLAARRYYGHPRNAFWPIMEAIFAGGGSLDYSERAELLVANRVALWDVLHAAVRPGSLDSDIVSGTEVPNDVVGFLAEHPGIRAILFNGTAAESLFRRFVSSGDLPDGLEFRRLPSTSPAHAGRTFGVKLGLWRDALMPYLQPEGDAK